MNKNLKTYLYFGGIFLVVISLLYFLAPPKDLRLSNENIVKSSAAFIECLKPQDLNVSNANNQFTITWEDPAAGPPSTYAVQYENTQTPGTYNIISLINNPAGGPYSVTKDNLTPGESYKIYVLYWPGQGGSPECNGNGDPSVNGVSFGPLVFPGGTCESPDNVQNTPYERSIDISWDFPTDDQYITDYEIRLDGTYTSIVSNTTSSFSIPNLTPSTNYIIEVCSVCDLPGQASSTECVKLPSIATLACPAPSTAGVSFSSITPTAFTVSWPSANLQTETYRVYYSTEGVNDYSNFNDVFDTTSTTFSGLATGTSYQVKVCSTCGDGGDTSNCTDWKVVSTEEGCNAPVNGATSHIQETQISLSWGHPSENQYIQSYKVYVDGSLEQTIVSTATTYTINGLSENTSYAVSICSYCDVPGVGTTETCTDLGNITTSSCPAPGSLSFSNITTTSYKVSWPSANLQTETYRVYHRPVSDPTNTTYKDDVNSPFVVTFDGLSPETAYETRICSTCGDFSSIDNCTAWQTVTTASEPGICDAPNNAVVNAGPDQSICPGDTTQLSASPTNGLAPFTYAWSTGDTSINISVDPSVTTTYSVTMTDANGCEGIDEVIVTTLATPSLSFTTNPVSCGETNGSAIVSATGGSGDYSYLWPSGWPQANSGNLGIGTYTVTVTDDITGCVVEGTTTISGTPAATADVGPDQFVCYGGSTILTVTPGGIAPYTYQWSNGASSQSTSVSPNLSSTTYSVTVTDANGCTATDQVVVNRGSQSIINLDKTDASCGLTNGSVSVSALGSSGPYTYLWNTGSTNSSLNNVDAGTYSVTVTDADNCTYTDSISLSNTPAASVSLGADEAICEGVSLTLSPITGGTTPITYQWSTGATDQNLTVTPTQTTTYAVTITDDNGCMATDQVTITVFDSPAISLSKTNGSCGQDNGAITTTIAGGTAPFTYSWSNGASSQDLSNLGAGTYTLSLSDANGCTDQATITLTASPQASLDLGPDQSICEGDSYTLTPTSSGTGTLSYSWSTGATTESINVSPANTTTYSVTLTDAEGCMAEDEIVINIWELPSVTLTKVDASCGLANGSISANVSGGQAPYSYNWSNGGSTNMIDNINVGTYSLTLTDANGCSVVQSATISNTVGATVDAGNDETICAGESISISAPGTGPGPYDYQWSHDVSVTSATITVSPASTQTYSVTLTASNGCTAEDQVTITVLESPTVELGDDMTICEGESASLNANATGASSYNWSTGQNTPSITITPGNQTTYSLTVTNSNGCQVVDTIQVNVSASPIFTFTPTNEACGQANGAIGVNVGTGNYTYNWSTGATTSSINNLSAGTYSLTLTNEDGCEASSAITLVNQNSAEVNIGNDTTICAGNSITLSATPLSGTAPYSYSWSSGEQVQTINVSPTTTTTYYVTLTDAGGCNAIDSITVSLNELPLADAGPDQTICPGSVVTLGGTPIGPEGASYLWSSGPNGTISPNDNGQIVVSPIETTTFSLAITDANGCSSTDQVTITVADSIQLTTTVLPGSCQDSLGGAFVSVNGGISPYTYQWSNGASADTISGVGSGIYEVTVTAANGCSATTSVEIQTGSVMTLSFTPQAESTNGAADGSASVSVIGGSPPYSYQWSNGATTASIDNLSSNIYDLTVTDSEGCSQTGSITIIVADGSDGNPLCTNISVSATIGEAGCDNEGLGQIALEVQNGQAPVSYQWSTGDTTPSIEELLPGTYHYTVVDANGCSVIDSSIIQDQDLVFTPIDTSICNIVNYIQAIPMDNNEVLFVVEGLSQASFDNIAQNASLTSANVVVNYQGPLGPRTESLNLFQSGSPIDINTWSMIIYDALYETNMVVSVQLQQDGACSVYCENTVIRWVEAVQDSVEAVIEENPPIELVGYECGEEFTSSMTGSTVPLSTATTSDLFYVYDFPILLTQVSGSNGSFSGQGIVPLPFNKQTVKVIFQNVSVNNDYQIWDGEVHAVADTLANYGVMPDTIVFGGEICVKPPEISYDWGFDENGIHSGTGTMYDENGFDANGNHKDTQGPYNLDGCNREGRDREGQKCDPRSVTEEVQAFLDTMSSNIPSLATDILNEQKQVVEDALGLQSAQCNALRTGMDSLLNILGYDRQFIFGENDEYFNKGMHLQFETPPHEMVLDVPRDPNTKELEKKHVALYTCDETEYKLETLLDRITTALGAEGLQALQDYIIDQIKGLSNEKVATFSDPTAYNEWLLEQIELYLEDNEAEEDIGYLEEPAIKEYNSPKMRFNQYETLAAAGDFSGSGLSEREQIIRELDFQFQQGFKYINGVHRAFFLEEIGKLQSLSVNENGENLLPIKVSKVIGGYRYTIHLDHIIFTPTGAVLDAFLILEDPKNTGRRLVFEVLNAGFGPAGLNTGSTLELVSETEITLSNAARLVLKGGGRNYVDWDCTGFLGMHLDAEVELCRNFITPLHPVTLEPLDDTTHYRLKFEAYIYEWLDLVIGVDAEPFSITGMEDIKWEMDSMYIDLSDQFTPVIEPPDGYASPYMTEDGMSPLWRGFYMRELSATLPNEFMQIDSTSADSNATLTIGVEDVIIDGCGVSGQLFVEELISIADGSAGGWPFSIDKLGIKVLHNQLAGGEFSGDINVPIFEGNMRYEAAIFPNNRYKLTVHPNEKETVNVFLAEAVIYPNSKVELELDQGEFTAIATLSGELEFKLPDDIGLDLNLPELRFCNLKISNKNPYFNAGVWEISNLDIGMKMGGFGIDINNIRPYQGNTPTEAGLNFDLDVTLSKVHRITAGGGFGVVGELEEVNKRQKWKFKKIQIHQLFIDANIKDQVHIKGSLTHFENHNVYGEGFSGLLSADFKDFGFKADAAGQFGKIDTFDYFFVDVLVDAGLGLGTGPIQVDGFGGGISYHMENNFNATSINFGNAVGAVTSAPPIGVSFSGVQYTPNDTIGLGIKATALISTFSKNIFNGSVSLEVLFNDPDVGGGLRQIGMKGNGHFLTPPDGLIPPEFQKLPNAPPPRTAMMSAFIDMKLRFDTLSLSGDLAVYLNVLGILRGAGHNNSLCRASVYFSPNDWFINIGTPTNPCGTKLEIPLVGGITSKSYFDIGTSIPDFPELPANVRSIANKIQSNEGLRKSGGGFMFGSSFDLDYELKNLGPIKGFLNAGVGYDVMLRDYGNAICAESGQRVGIDGWYAAGQMWAYIDAGIKLFGVPILEAGLAAVLQARLPNPFWAKATIAGRVKVLFVQKRFNIAVEMGQLCTLTSDDPNDLIGMELITYTNPDDGAAENLTDVQPEVYFAVPMKSVFELPDEQGNMARFEAKVKSYSLYSTNYGEEYPSSFELFNNNGAVRLIPNDLLPANDSLIATIIIKIEKNGQFFAEEERTFSFTTGEAFDHIPQSNVAYSYPLNGMYEFYKEQYVLSGDDRKEGAIQLISGQPDLFFNLDEGQENKLKLENAGGTKTYLEITYDGIERKIEFKLPPSAFNNGELYKMTLVRQENGEDDQEISQPIYFRVSDFNTFGQKIEAINATPNQSGLLTSDAGVKIAKNLQAIEPFDDISLSGTEKLDPLVVFEANLGNDWYRDQVKPLIYDEFPLTVSICGAQIGFVEEGSVFGQPQDAAGIHDKSLTPIFVGADQFNSGAYFINSKQSLYYSVPSEALKHFQTLQLQIASCVQLIMENHADQIVIEGVDDPGQDPGSGGGEDDPMEDHDEDEAAKRLLPEALWNIYRGEFPKAPHGTYKIDARYYLPKGDVISIREVIIDTTAPNSN